MRGVSMGEYFAGQQGMGEYFAAQNGLGEYFPGVNGSLVDWARQEEREHPGIFGLGADAVPTPAPTSGPDLSSTKAVWFGMFAAGGLVGGLLVATLLKSNKTAGAGIGAVAGLIGGYFTRPA